MDGHAEKCVERCCEVACKSVSASELAASPCMDDHLFALEMLVFGQNWYTEFSVDGRSQSGTKLVAEDWHD